MEGNVSRVWLGLGLLLIVLGVGCMPGEPAGAMDDNDAKHDPAVEAVAKMFGEAVMHGDWAKAYSLTTPAFQASVSQSALQGQYDDLINQIKQGNPDFKVDMVEVDHGELPTDEKEMRETYNVTTAPPKSQWKARLFSLIGKGDQGEMYQGVEAMLLVVDEGGQNKIAHAEFAFQD